MRLLLDTHILLWWLAGDPALPAPARCLIQDPENTMFVSTVSLWEIWLKHSLGKLRLPEDFEEKLARESFENLPLTAAHTRGVALLPWHHRDPFDRMLIAQAQAERLNFLTADEIAAAYGDMVLLAG
ncbi:MAG: type II toxin-antitoxin system VapC family toxin [Acidobacteria bacterium]|nr:type II toxin-antitoxin system VapC family toxin [Acidobacteriota bacterium]MBI3279147.1 type II toxin-antitoxin system VapC family toxin [Acidobacteriota bacterium]